MIAHLKGVLAEKAAGRVVVDVSGVGYEVLIPYSTYYELGEDGDTVSLHIYTHVKEDAFSLYGFSTSKEKRLFTQLIQISGIGPKLGVAILSGMPVGEFVEAVTDKNVVKLNEIPGVGKKTAERLVLEMKDKVMEWFPSSKKPKQGVCPVLFRVTWYRLWSIWAILSILLTGQSPGRGRKWRRIPLRPF